MDNTLTPVRQHKHTCAACWVGARLDACDCGAIDSAGLPIPDQSAELTRLRAQVEGLQAACRVAHVGLADVKAVAWWDEKSLAAKIDGIIEKSAAALAGKAGTGT